MICGVEKISASARQISQKTRDLPRVRIIVTVCVSIVISVRRLFVIILFFKSKFIVTNTRFCYYAVANNKDESSGKFKNTIVGLMCILAKGIIKSP